MKRIWREIQSRTDHRQQIFLLIMVLAFLQGLIYIFITPPWWHHDESGHFQYAWLVANQPGWPKGEQYDVKMRKELAKSLENSGFYKYNNYKLDPASDKPWVQAPQTDDPPLYYAVASLPLRLLKNTSLVLQLRVLRLLALCFFLLTLWVCWKLGGEIFGPHHTLQIISIVFLAFLPGFANEMTSVSDMPPAVLLYSLFLLIGVQLLKTGFSWKKLISFCLLAMAAIFTNNTVWTSIPVLFVLVLLILSFRRHSKFEWIPAAVIGIILLASAFIGFQRGESKYWIVLSPSQFSVRHPLINAPLGHYVLRLENSNSIQQRIPAKTLEPLRGKTLTLGFWAWASEPVVITSPIIRFLTASIENPNRSFPMKLSTRPHFFSIQQQVPSDSGRGLLVFNPRLGRNPTGTTVIFIDGIVLANGDRGKVAPKYTDISADSGTWNGEKFVNLVSNGSSESSWLRFNPAILNFGLKYLPSYISPSILPTLQDWRGSGWYFQQTIGVLNDTFWGKLGPSFIPLLGSPYIYRFLLLLSLFGIVGFILLLTTRYRQMDLRLLLFLGVSLLILWGQTILRGAGSLDLRFPIIPWARYALPVFFPTVMILCAGWYFILRFLEKKFSLQISLAWPLFISLLFGLNLMALLTLLNFFYFPTQFPYMVLVILLIISLGSSLFLWQKAGLKNSHAGEPDK